MSKSRKKNFTITAEQTFKGLKSAQRDQMISQGAQTLRASIVHTSLKDYSRKKKHKNEQY